MATGNLTAEAITAERAASNSKPTYVKAWHDFKMVLAGTNTSETLETSGAKLNFCSLFPQIFVLSFLKVLSSVSSNFCRMYTLFFSKQRFFSQLLLLFRELTFLYRSCR